MKQRVLALVLSLSLLMSLLPTAAFATEEKPTESGGTVTEELVVPKPEIAFPEEETVSEESETSMPAISEEPSGVPTDEDTPPSSVETPEQIEKPVLEEPDKLESQPPVDMLAEEGGVSTKIIDNLTTVHSIKYDFSSKPWEKTSGAAIIEVDCDFHYPGQMGYARISPAIVIQISNSANIFGNESWNYVTVDNNGGRFTLEPMVTFYKSNYLDGMISNIPISPINGKINVTVYSGFLAYADDNHASKTFYISNPSKFEIDIINNIAGTIDPSESDDQSFKPSLNEFDPYIYQAGFLQKKSNPTVHTINDILFSATPCVEMEVLLQKNGFEDSVAAWKSFETISDIIDSPSSGIYDFCAKPKDLYTGVIMTALEAAISYDVVQSDLNEALSLSNKLIKDVNEVMKTKHNLDITDDKCFKSMTTQQKEDLENTTSEWFKKNQPDLADLQEVFSGVTKGIGYFNQYKGYVEYVLSCMVLANIGEDMKAVLNQMYQESKSFQNINLQLALLDCVTIVNSSTDKLILEILGGGFKAVGVDIGKYLIDEFLWKEIQGELYAACPAAAIFHQAYKTGKFVSNTLVSTDDTIEQYLKMLAITDIETLMDKTYEDLQSAYIRQKNRKSATVYLKALDLLFTLRKDDATRAYDFVDILDNTLINKIASFFGKDSFSETKEYLKIRKANYITTHLSAGSAWVNSLEVDYPNSGLYELFDEIVNSKYSQTKKREFKISATKSDKRNAVLRLGDNKTVNSCQIDIYVYDESGELVASIEEGKFFSNGNVMIAECYGEKTVYVYDDADYRIECIGKEAEKINISIAEYDAVPNSAVRTIDYYDVPLKENRQYSLSTKTNASQDAIYTLTDVISAQEIKCDFDSLDRKQQPLHRVSIISGLLMQNGELKSEIQAAKGEKLILIAHVPEDCIFVHWEIDSGDAVIKDSSAPNTCIIVNDDVQIRAVVKLKQGISHSLTFDPGRGTGTMEPLIVTGDELVDVTLPKCTFIPPTKESCYVSWEIKGKNYQSGTSYPVTSDITAKAIWTDHIHTFGIDWKSDAENHWHECTCGAKSEIKAHTFTETSTAEGKRIRTCSICGYKIQVPVEPEQQVFTPIFTPNGGSFQDSICVEIASDTIGASIYYAMGADTAFIPYTGPITLRDSTTLKAYAVKDGMTTSETVTATYTKESDGTDHSSGGSDETSSNGGSYSPSYNITVPKTENGTVSISPRNASKGDIVTITANPDKGYVVDSILVSDAHGNSITVTDKGNGKFTFTMPADKVDVKTTFRAEQNWVNPFYDVPSDAYYYDAVAWAAQKGITGGTSATTFSPDAPCTRAQIVTFLWRTAGSPEPVGFRTNFTDVPADSYYASAVLWAVENKITGGTSATTFSPDAVCTRAQAVTFLHHAEGVPAVGDNSFADVRGDAYYADAVAWAAQKGITSGTSTTTFSPDMDCTRAQIMTFLYRTYNK